MFNELRNFFLRYRYIMGDFMTEYVAQTKCLRYVFKCYVNIRNNRNCFLFSLLQQSICLRQSQPYP